MSRVSRFDQERMFVVLVLAAPKDVNLDVFRRNLQQMKGGELRRTYRAHLVSRDMVREDAHGRARRRA